MTNFNSIWFHIGSFLFTSQAFFSNILYIRCLIIAGNIMFIINAALGWPFWPNIYRPEGNVAWETITWSIINGGLNFITLIRELKSRDWKWVVEVPKVEASSQQSL